MSELERVGLLANLDKPRAHATVEKLGAWLRSEGRTIVGPPDLRRLLRSTYQQVEPTRLGEHCDLLIVLGGDGTLLGAARAVAGSELPILGVNLGALGFLTEVPDRELFATVEAVLDGKYELEKRTMLEATLVAQDGAARELGIALNDAVVHAGVSSKLIELALRIDDQQLGQFRADGLIVSTPTGSTAYSLAAGGPLVRPTIPAFVATPICAHSLAVRPLLFDDRETIHIGVGPPEVPAYVALDGVLSAEFTPPATVIVSKSPHRTTLVLPGGRSFYNLVGTKLHWGGPKQNDAHAARRS